MIWDRFPRLDRYRADPAQPLTTVGEKLDDLDHDTVSSAGGEEPMCTRSVQKKAKSVLQHCQVGGSARLHACPPRTVCGAVVSLPRLGCFFFFSEVDCSTTKSGCQHRNDTVFGKALGEILPKRRPFFDTGAISPWRYRAVENNRPKVG